MTIPSYTHVMLPLLQLAGDGHEHRLSETIEVLAEYFGLTDLDRLELTAGGKQLKFNHRVGYAALCLRKAGLLESTGRGVLHITPLGRDVLTKNLLHINRAFLMQFPGFVDFVTRSQPEKAFDAEPTDFLEAEHTPKELMHILYTGVQKELMDDLLETILAASPAFFEKLVVDLLVAMGYGANQARRLGRSGDGGVDGVIQEDKLGLDVVYVQAKRYARQNVVGRPLVQAFIGSLIGQGAQRGVMLTTSRYSKEAVQYAKSMQQHKVILIDGVQLTQLMIEHNVGVSIEETYVLKKVDQGYFHES